VQEALNAPTFPSITNLDAINLKVTRRVTHQLVTRVFAIFLREIINYDKPIELDHFDEDQEFTDFNDKMYEYYSIAALQEKGDANNEKASINLEIWRTPDAQIKFPDGIYEGNSLSEDDIARYILYIPKALRADTKFFYNYFMSNDLNYHTYEKFFRLNNIGQSDLCKILKCESITSKQENITNGVFIPHHCISDTEPCATVLTSHYIDTRFFINIINTLKLKMKVYFLGDHLRTSISRLTEIIKNSRNKQLFLVLHWKPSEMFDSIDMSDEVEMPKCELYKNEHTSCKFDVNSVSIYYNDHVTKSVELNDIMHNLKFKSLLPLLKAYNQLNVKKIYDMRSLNKNLNLLTDDTEENDETIDDIYNKVACEWIRGNPQIYDPKDVQKWYEPSVGIDIKIGGM
jgi:hypothetical protein